MRKREDSKEVEVSLITRRYKYIKIQRSYRKEERSSAWVINDLNSICCQAIGWRRNPGGGRGSEDPSFFLLFFHCTL